VRKLVIPADVVQAVIDCDHGSRTNLKVTVDWPELGDDKVIEMVFER
jgi:hypothetical protein